MLCRDHVSYRYGNTRSGDVPLSVINNLFTYIYINIIYTLQRKDCSVFSITPPSTIMISETPTRVVDDYVKTRGRRISNLRTVFFLPVIHILYYYTQPRGI